MRASQLDIGQSSTIVSLADSEVSLRLLELGIRPGAIISLLRRAPFKGAAFVSVGQAHFALRESELDHIILS